MEFRLKVTEFRTLLLISIYFSFCFTTLHLQMKEIPSEDLWSYENYSKKCMFQTEHFHSYIFVFCLVLLYCKETCWLLMLFSSVFYILDYKDEKAIRNTMLYQGF